MVVLKAQILGSFYFGWTDFEKFSHYEGFVVLKGLIFDDFYFGRDVVVLKGLPIEVQIVICLSVCVFCACKLSYRPQSLANDQLS